MKRLVCALLLLVLLAFAGCSGEKPIHVVYSDPAMESAAQTVADALAGWTDQSVTASPDGPGKGYNVVLSVQGMKDGNGLRPQDYLVTFEKGTMNIIGGSVEALETAGKLLGKKVLEGCSQQDIFSGNKTAFQGWSAAYRIGAMEVGGRELYEFVIVADANSQPAKELQSIIANQGGYDLPIVSAQQYKQGDPAFIFQSGHTSRGDELSKSLQEDQHLLKIEGLQIYFLSWSQEKEHLPYKMFLAKYWEYSYVRQKAGQWDAVFNETVQMKFTTKLEGEKEYQSVMNQVLKIHPLDDWYCQQGACTDGKYGYFILVGRKFAQDETGKIVKVDLSTWETVAISDALPTYHSNDMTYNPTTGKLYVVHNKPQRTKVSVIDPETLTVENIVTLGQEIYCMSYSPERGQYVIGHSSTDSTFSILDQDFSHVKLLRGPVTGHLTQGCDADGNYIYAVRSEKDNDKGNKIFLFDWNGKGQGSVLLSEQTEAENMFHIDELWYISFFDSGNTCFETIAYKEIP